MDTKFKIGDKVKIMSYGDWRVFGVIGSVVDVGVIGSGFDYKVEFQMLDRIENSWSWFHEDNLELTN